MLPPAPASSTTVGLPRPVAIEIEPPRPVDRNELLRRGIQRTGRGRLGERCDARAERLAPVTAASAFASLRGAFEPRANDQL